RALCKQLIKLHGVLSEDLDGPSHRSDLVRPEHRNRDVAPPTGDRQHRAAQLPQACYDVAADVEPSDQCRADQAERDDKSQSNPSKLADRSRLRGCRRNAPLRSGDKPPTASLNWPDSTEFCSVRRRPSPPASSSICRTASMLESPIALVRKRLMGMINSSETSGSRPDTKPSMRRIDRSPCSRMASRAAGVPAPAARTSASNAIAASC